MLKTASTSNLNCVEFHLNDLNPSILARNITILKIISASDFNPSDEEDVAFLWDVWYNSEWPDITRKRFQIVLNDLLDECLLENISIPKSQHLESLKKVWSAWHLLLSSTNSKSQLLMEKVDEER